MDQQGKGVGVSTGVRVGIPLAVLALIVTALYDTGHVPGWVQAIEFVIALGAFFYAGLRAARETRRTGTGAVAGLVCSLFMAVVILGANVIMALVAPSQYAIAFGFHGLSASALVMASLISSAGGLIVWAIIGLVCGALGGLIGKRRGAASSGTTASPTVS